VPFRIHRREQVKRLSAASRLAHHVDVGFAVEERKQPTPHDFVVVNHQHVDGFILREVHLWSDPFPPGRELVRLSPPVVCSRS